MVLVGGMVMGLVGCAPSNQSALPNSSPPPLYVGLDSYLHWDKLPYLEIGDRVAGQSTADPGGSNNDNVNILSTLPDGERVLFDQVGPGLVTFMRMQQHTGGPWNLTVDGDKPPTVITEADLGRTNPTDSPASSFPYPLSMNTSQSQGSSILATQFPYSKSLRFTSSAANGNFYSIYRKLPVDVPPPKATSATTNQVAALLNSAGGDITPAGIRQERGTVSLAAEGAPIPVATISGRNEIRAVTFRVPFADMVRFGNSRLRVYWDNETTPSVDAPIKFLAGDGAGVYQPSGRQLVTALPATITGDGRTYLEFSLYWPMPFTSSARIVVVPSGGGAAPVPVDWSVRYQPFTDPPNWVGKFHANYTDVPNPEPGKDMSFLDFRGSGKLIGTVINFGAVGSTLEGDPHIYLDDSQTPQIAVTGTEEWGMGGDYWNNGKQTSLPMAGLPSTTKNPPGADVDGAAEYRFLIADSIPFNNHIVVHWEHGALNDTTQNYRATMLWYGTPTVTAVVSDEVVPGLSASTTAHGYHSTADRPYSLTSAYEQTVHSPLITNTVVATNTSTTFTMAVEPANTGAFLRRTFDSCVANQRANVFIDGTFAGAWYNAGASRKTGDVHTDRCWRDDDIPLPKSLTAGKRSINIRIDNVATASPQNTVWTAADYKLFRFTMG
jgi:hypothetical protein